MTYKYIMPKALLSVSLLALALPAQGQTNNVDNDVDEVVATGIRQSLEEAADLKRNDSRIVDLIVAEDIGKLPDNNIAEALQRVTGVSINRDFGVGDSVSIRGLPQNRVEINGRSTLGDGRNGVSFQDVPAEILSGIEVIKSPTPEMVEGALGGTINLKTRRPLNLREQVLSLSAKAEYTDKTENIGPILNATYGDKFDAGASGTLGVIASLSYQDRELREDEYRSSLEVNPVDQDGAGPMEASNLIVPRNFSTFIGTEQRERIAGNLSLQWAPTSDKGFFYLEGTYTKRDGSDETFSPNLINNSPINTPEELADGFRIDDTQQIVGFTDQDVRFINRTESGFRNTESFSGAFGFEWQFTEKFKLSSEATLANSDTFNPYIDLRFYGVDPVAEAANPSANNFFEGQVFYDTDNDSLPTVRVTDPNTWLRQDIFALRRLEDREDNIENRETAFRLDGTLEQPFDKFSILNSVKTGIRFTNREFESTRDRLFVANIHTSLQDAATGADRIIYMNEFPDGTIRDFDFNAFRGNDTAFDLETFTMFDPSIVQDRARTRGIVSDLLAGTNFEALANSGLAPQLDRTQLIDEQTTAAYLQFDIQTQFGAVPMQAVGGVRYVKTDLTAEGFSQTQGMFAPVEEDNSYEDWLPSLNVTFEVQPDLLVRGAFAKVMRRPDFGQLSPAILANQDSTFATRGNPQLEPFRATQYDISVEKYWGDGNLLSAALFYKDVASFFDETEICLNSPSLVAVSNANRRDELCFLDGRGGNPSRDPAVTPDSQIGIPTQTQINGDSGSIKGFELGYQQAFTFLPGAFNGLGISTNYTYSDSEDPNGRPLEDISKHTFNVTGYYERDGLGLRLAYTYRDRFLDDILNGRVRQLGDQLLDGAGDDPTEGNSYREPIKQLDASLSYDINDTFTLLADAVNLTGEQIYDTGTTTTLWRVLESDRRYSVGIRAKF